MSAGQVELVASRALFRPRGRLWELHELHVPFDYLSDTSDYEQRAITRLTAGACVAVIGPSGAGKSSVISWLCRRLPGNHVALRIPITGVEDPGSVGEVARLALSVTLDQVILDADGEGELRQARADGTSSTRAPSVLGAKLGGGPIPAEISVNTSSLQQEFREDRLQGEYLLALNGRLVPVLADAGTIPVFVFEDTEATVGGGDARNRAEAFFAGPLRAFVEQVDAPTVVAVQTHLIEDSPAFERLAPLIERLIVPTLDSRARRVVGAILARRIDLAGLGKQITAVIDDEGIEELSGFYRQSRGDLRRVLAAAHEAAEHAASETAQRIGPAHIRFGIAQWQ